MNIEKCSFAANTTPIPQQSCAKIGPRDNLQRYPLLIRSQNRPEHTQPVLSDRFDNDITNPWTGLFSQQWPEYTILGDDTDHITRTLFADWCAKNPQECQRFKPRPNYIPGQQYPQLPIPRGDGINYNLFTQPIIPFSSNIFGNNPAAQAALTDTTLAAQIGAAVLTGGLSIIIEAAILYPLNIITQFISQALGLEGRPKEAATDEISRYANSRSPVLSLLGIGGYQLAIRNIPISSPDAGHIFGPYFRQAAELLLKENLDHLDTLKKCANFLALCLHAMGNPNDSQWAIQWLTNEERKAGFIPTAAQEKAIKARNEEHNTKVNRAAIRRERGWEHRYNTPVSRRHASARA